MQNKCVSSRGSDRMIVFTSTYTINAYHHKSVRVWFAEGTRCSGVHTMPLICDKVCYPRLFGAV